MHAAEEEIKYKFNPLNLYRVQRFSGQATFTKIKDTSVVFDEAYYSLIKVKSRIPYQWAVPENPQNHCYLTKLNNPVHWFPVNSKYEEDQHTQLSSYLQPKKVVL